MSRTYIAKGPHKRTCDLCNDPILPGDKVATWCWVAEEIQDSNIMRVHDTCNTIYEREGMEEFTRGRAFEDTKFQYEATVALADARGKHLMGVIWKVFPHLSWMEQDAIIHTLQQNQKRMPVV